MSLPQDVNDKYLEMNEARGGKLTTQDIVDEARDQDSVLHPRYEWDNTIAGEAHRRQQARMELRRVTITVTTPPTRSLSPRFVRNPDVPSHTQGYQDVLSATADQKVKMLEAMIARAITQIESAYVFGVSMGCDQKVLVELLEVLNTCTLPVPNAAHETMHPNANATQLNASG
jgi:hypothetical protein